MLRNNRKDLKKKKIRRVRRRRVFGRFLFFSRFKKDAYTATVYIHVHNNKLKLTVEDFGVLLWSRLVLVYSIVGTLFYT